VTLWEHYEKAGSDAAVGAFGLIHGTPLPPATWTQQWQQEPVKNVQKKVTIPSMSEENIGGHRIRSNSAVRPPE
jgi:hypothetical protein